MAVAYAVIQSNLFYQMAPVSAAVELCFKACFVFSLCYSAAAKSTWTFLQVGIFDIKTEHDEVGWILSSGTHVGNEPLVVQSLPPAVIPLFTRYTDAEI
jgi:hypothetical protein